MEQLLLSSTQGQSNVVTLSPTKLLVVHVMSTYPLYMTLTVYEG